MRTLKPDFFRSLTLCNVERGVRLTFAGLWTECDDAGRMVWDPRLVKAALYPLDVDITAEVVIEDVAALSRIGAVHVYERDGRQYLHIPAWRDHQHPNRPTDSSLPACADSGPDGKAQCTLTHSSLSAQGALTPVLSCSVEVLSRSDTTESSPSRQAETAAKKPKPTKKTSAPKDFEITLELRSWAKTNGITANLANETQQWLDHHRAKNTIGADWAASWRYWMRNTLKYGSSTSKATPSKPVNGW